MFYTYIYKTLIFYTILFITFAKTYLNKSFESGTTFMSEFFFAVNCNMFIRYSSLMKTRGLHLNFFRAFQNGRAIAQLHGMTARQKGRG